MYFDKKHFHLAANEILDDIKDCELRSKSWTWLAAGAIVGFLGSCVRLNKKSGRPILARFNKFCNKGE